MKWYSHRLHKFHTNDMKVKRGDPLEVYYPWVIQIANTFTRDAVAIGALNLQDLIQAGYLGLLEAWDNVDEERDQAQKWSFIKKRIKFTIRREIDNHGAFIKVPRRALEDHRKHLTSIDKILVNAFPKFFEVILFNTEEVSSWESVQLGELIDDYLYTNFNNYDHIEILRASFGIDREKRATLKELALAYDTTPNYINQIKQRLIKRLREDENFEKIINNFYQDTIQ